MAGVETKKVNSGFYRIIVLGPAAPEKNSRRGRR